MINKNSIHRLSFLIALLSLGITLLLYLYSPDVEAAIRQSMDLCARVLIPSLFPFMVISALYVRFGIADTLCKPFSPLFRRFFRLPGCAASAVFLGAVCGFPIGAKTACELYQTGELTKEQTERLIAAANNTGPSFIVEVIGAYYWNSRGFGLFLYCMQIVGALLLSGILARRKPLPPESGNENRCTVTTPGECVAQAVSSSVSSVLGICGFVSFFSAILAVLRVVLNRLGAENSVPFLASLLEFSCGSAEAASTGGLLGAFLSGFSVGWAGFSVLAQCSMFTASLGLSLRIAVYSKAAQGMICGGSAVLWYLLTDLESTKTCSAFSSKPSSVFFLVCEILLLLLFYFLTAFVWKHRNTKRNTSDFH